jgi:uncharacterized membrane protein YhhN
MSGHLSFARLSFLVALILALLNWIAVARDRRRLVYVFKPATLVAVLGGAWLLTHGPHDAWQARFFLPGLVFSLAGDIFLMLLGERFFLYGLISFLFGHVCYVVGMNPTLPSFSSLAFLVAVALIWVLFYRFLATGMRRQGQTSLLAPVAIYSAVIGLMLFSAWATLFRPEWTPLRRGLVIVGASLFTVSDGMLATNRFVTSFSLAPLWVMVTYHLSQMALAASVAL